MPEMKTVPWHRTMASAARLERLVNNRGGIIGYLATFHSLIRKRTKVMNPKTRRHRTVAESQAKDTPPYPSPRRNITVPPVARMTPVQSMAFRPSSMGVLGVSISRNNMMMAKAIPSKGTEETSVGFERRDQGQKVTYG